MGVGMRKLCGIKRDTYKSLQQQMSDMPNRKKMFIIGPVTLTFSLVDGLYKAVVTDTRVTDTSCIDVAFETPWLLSPYNIYGEGTNGSIIFYADSIPDVTVTCNILVSNL